MELAERAELLAKQLIEPLCTGATLRLQRPFGQALCQEIGPHRTIVDNELKLSVQQARICAARQVLPVDSIPDLSAPEWTLAAALNDLLQSTNHELSNIVTRDRHEELAEQVTATCSQLPQPATLGEALARHSTFCNINRLKRVDTKVSWWTGSESFRGQDASDRLLYWPDLRNVNTEKVSIAFEHFASDLTYIDQTRHESALRAWLAASPLTDLGNVRRQFPRFAWSAASLGLLATSHGFNMALRVVLRDPQLHSPDSWDRTHAALDQAAQWLKSAATPAAYEMAQTFAQQVRQAEHLHAKHERLAPPSKTLA